ncbi:hypothetical protein E1I37_09780 [Campylobacter coli]|nr:hypothetical protein [Campylobacter coli]
MKFKKFLLTLIPFIFIGCASVKTEFIYPKIPDIKEPPITQDYNLTVIKINNVEYYSLSSEDAKILSENWIKFKSWAETNYELLKIIKNKDLK